MVQFTQHSYSHWFFSSAPVDLVVQNSLWLVLLSELMVVVSLVLIHSNMLSLRAAVTVPAGVCPLTPQHPLVSTWLCTSTLTLCPPDPGPFNTHQTKTHQVTIYYHLSTLPLSSPPMECVRIIKTRRWGSAWWFLGRLQYHFPEEKNSVYSDRITSDICCTSVCWWSLDSLISLITSVRCPLSLLSSLRLQWHLAFFICLPCVCKRCAFVPKTTFVVLLSLHTRQPWAHPHLAS